MISKRSYIFLTGLMLVSHLGYAAPSIDPSVIKPGISQPGKVPGPTPQLRLKPDLIVQSVGYSAEFCESNCSDQWTRELGVTRMSAETCHFVVGVKNIGNATSRAGKVRVQYDSLTTVIQLTGNMPAIRAGQTKSITVPINNARPVYLYRKFRAPIIATADSTNTSAETNERNNTKQIYQRY